MKLRITLVSIAVLVAAIILFFLLRSSGNRTSSLTLEEIQQMSPERQTEVVLAAFRSGNLPDANEGRFIAWAFESQPEVTADLIRDNANQIAGLPTFLSDAALLLVRTGKPEVGVQLLSVGQSLYPNNPDILGITGIVAYLGGRPVEARQFLEEAETWQQDRPIIKFYLGGILIDSEIIAERTRGKNLLLTAVNSNDAELSELSALILLTKPEIPLIEQDVDLLLEKTRELNVFRPDNDNLSVTVLRVIINRLVEFRPKEALNLADLLMQYPGAALSDRLGFIQLAQDLGQAEIAGEQLAKVREAGLEIPEDSGTGKRVARLAALQLLAEGDYEDGIMAFEELVRTQPEQPALRNAFQTAISFDLPITAERALLIFFLDLPAENVSNSLNILTRLVEIAPLRESDWIAYARDFLLPMDPVTVSQWLMSVDAAETTIEALAAKEGNRTSKERIALVESYLFLEQPDLADEILAGDNGGIEPSIQAYLECRIRLQQGNETEAFEAWKFAQQQATSGGRFVLVKNLGFLALELDQEVNALQSLYTAFSAGIAFNREQAAQLLGLTLEFGNLAQSIAVSEFLVESYPEEATYINNLSYFYFLAEDNIEASVEKMRTLVEDYPDINQYRLTLALGLVKAGRTNEASRIVQSTNIDWNETATRSQMIYAVVLAASNQRVVAEGLIRNLDVESLIPEEQALLEAF